MSALLALIPTKDWVYGILIIGLILLGLHEKTKFIAEGIAEQKAADDKATAVLVATTAKQTADLQARATMAEQAYDKEHQAILDQPSLPAVRLCGNPHPRSTIVSATGATQQGNAVPGASSGAVQQVPSGNSSGGAGDAGPDIGNLLSLLAQRADETSAELREFQARE